MYILKYSWYDNAVGPIAIFEIIQDFFFLIDIIFTLNTGIHENGGLIMLRAPITIAYFKLWFWIDIIASFPYPIVISYQEYFSIYNANIEDNTMIVIQFYLFIG